MLHYTDFLYSVFEEEKLKINAPHVKISFMEQDYNYWFKYINISSLKIKNARLDLKPHASDTISLFLLPGLSEIVGWFDVSIKLGRSPSAIDHNAVQWNFNQLGKLMRMFLCWSCQLLSCFAPSQYHKTDHTYLRLNIWQVYNKIVYFVWSICVTNQFN